MRNARGATLGTGLVLAILCGCVLLSQGCTPPPSIEADGQVSGGSEGFLLQGFTPPPCKLTLTVPSAVCVGEVVEGVAEVMGGPFPEEEEVRVTLPNGLQVIGTQRVFFKYLTQANEAGTRILFIAEAPGCDPPLRERARVAVVTVSISANIRPDAQHLVWPFNDKLIATANHVLRAEGRPEGGTYTWVYGFVGGFSRNGTQQAATTTFLGENVQPNGPAQITGDENRNEAEVAVLYTFEGAQCEDRRPLNITAPVHARLTQPGNAVIVDAQIDMRGNEGTKVLMSESAIYEVQDQFRETLPTNDRGHSPPKSYQIREDVVFASPIEALATDLNRRARANREWTLLPRLSRDGTFEDTLYIPIPIRGVLTTSGGQFIPALTAGMELLTIGDGHRWHVAIHDRVNPTQITTNLFTATIVSISQDRRQMRVRVRYEVRVN